ncbi:chorismate mutase [Vagococcus humatus]|uniref:Chorismate mutase n=1 Tax=Vagococcus humatus TaxID=1889241 RepID=A0A3S0A4B0_9ENTE|nr:chorismate mutase [Vagococcus humatus]RST88565.1 chorismate mutase [Vagococcus humatus]
MLEKKREEINEIDQQLIQLLEKRLAVVSEIGQIKQQQNLSVLDRQREQAVLDQVNRWTQNEDYRLPIQKIMQKIMDESKLLQI